MIATGTRAHKQQEANRFIDSIIIMLHPGEALPSIRQLMAQSGFGRTVIENALKRCVEREMISSKLRMGYFRTDQRNHSFNRQIVDVIACSEVNYMNSPNNFLRQLAQSLFEIGSELNFSIRLHRVKNNTLYADYAKLVKEKSIFSCFLIAPENPRIEQYVNAAGAKSVVLVPCYIPEKGPAVVDRHTMVDLQLNYLFRRGHKRIAYIHEVVFHPVLLTQLLRRERYFQLMAQKGYQIYPEDVIYGMASDEQLKSDLDKMFRSYNPPTAIICNNSKLVAVYSFFQNRNMVIGKDISIISEGVDFELKPKPVAIFNSYKKAAEIAWQSMLSGLRGENNDTINALELSLLDGNSVADLSKLSK